MIPCLILFLSVAQNGVNPDAALIASFQNQVADYVKMTAKFKSGLAPLKATDSRDAITQRETELARQIQQARPTAAQGDFFSPAISAEFERLIGIALGGHRARRISKSLEHAEPVSGPLKVNAPYPQVPLQSMPPTLLANLPSLPDGLDYRIVGHSLILRDVNANLILDFIPKAIP
jgi:hypothetical protein